MRFIEESSDQLIKPQVCSADQVDNVTAHEEIWVRNSGKPSACDTEAANDLITLVGNDRFKSLLKDKTSIKKNVWGQIPKEMMTLGYNFGNRDPGTVCSQKWRNMQGKTITFIQNGGPKSTGSGKLKKPAFYDEVRDVIKDSAKAIPINCMDTMSNLSNQASPSSRASSSSGNNDSAYPQKSCQSSVRNSEEPLSDNEAKLAFNKENVNPFLKVQRTTKAKKQKVESSAIYNFLKQDAGERKVQNENLMKLLAQKMEQEKKSKRQMLEILSKLLDK
ncbi:uncharacterized protein LOC116850483 isoform X1 [Odontomachus brunneus]|uniref:uncharacterized protein LOC116850483 isoform X1 n=1 Tax=Odontomachus brunneus TaxID=486640 RepID=UPI0013F18E34|nr:uncharacterized protein LOC116850483 isoform X1 [Odontomachus brunneus]